MWTQLQGTVITLKQGRLVVQAAEKSMTAFVRNVANSSFKLFFYRGILEKEQTNALILFVSSYSGDLCLVSRDDSKMVSPAVSTSMSITSTGNTSVIRKYSRGKVIEFQWLVFVFVERMNPQPISITTKASSSLEPTCDMVTSFVSSTITGRMPSTPTNFSERTSFCHISHLMSAGQHRRSDIRRSQKDGYRTHECRKPL